MERETNPKPDGVREDSAHHRDSGKPMMMLLQLAALWTVAQVAERGVKKYGKRNWEEHAQEWEYSQLWDSAFRHLIKWALGQDLDKETGLPHLSHAAWNILSLLELTMRKLGKDDRSRLPNELLTFLSD